ncbi:MAG TPA: lipid IV(A) 3-deoxy-D-manno-octulosonic acid transferase [Cellvibrio sp.]|nr:lipid IV(A) 3-deoxy-D-manno-octulosonic acid transferase [Cellvibrio sp.]
MRFVYTLIFYLLLPLILLRLTWRALRAPAYAKRWSERFGFVPTIKNSGDKKVIWLHTVSVGEFIAALPLIRQLQLNPALQLVITTTTPTGSERVRASLGDSVFHSYAPYDIPGVLARFLNRTRPAALLIMETELWPNTLAACARRNIPSILINGRMSARSARGYQKFSGLTRPMLQQLSLGLLQNKDDAARMQQLGLSAENIRVTGNIKFDLSLSDDLRLQAAALKQQWSRDGERLIWIAASTHQGEDEMILDALQQARQANNPIFNNSLLVLVPRHPERFASVASLCERRGFKVARRSSQSLEPDADIIIGDTMGELLLLFGASDIAFVGGSLVANGGHNFIEPAAWGLPLLSGPHVFNFAEVSRLLQEAGGLVLVASAQQLAAELNRLTGDAMERTRRGQAALAVAHDNRGALQKTLAELEVFL